MDGNRRIAKDRAADRVKGGWRTKSVASPWNAFLVVRDRCLISSRRKLRAGNLHQSLLKKKRLKFRKTLMNDSESVDLSSVKPAARPTRRRTTQVSLVATIRVSIEWRVLESCPASKDVKKITASCMGHRREALVAAIPSSKAKAVGGATGCKYRYHLPPRDEPRYGDVASKMLQDVVQTEKQLDKQIEESRSNSTVRHAMKLNRDQLALAAERQAKERSIAKFKELKCDKHMDEHVLVSALQEYETSKAEEEKEGWPKPRAIPTEARTSSSTTRRRRSRSCRT